MKISDIIIYIIIYITKIMWGYFKKIRSRDMQKALKVQILNKVALRQVVRKWISFQDRKKENTPKFLSIKIWY